MSDAPLSKSSKSSKSSELFTPILCPVDFSEQSRHATECAIAIATRSGAGIALLHVVPPATTMATDVAPAGPRPPSAAMEAAQDEMAVWLQLPRAAGIPTRTFIDVGTPASAILSRATHLPADMIVIGTHGAGGIEHLVLGSVTEKVLRTSPCPVLVVPPRDRTGTAHPFRRIVCAVDFSDCSLAAVRKCFALARDAGAAVTLVHVIEWPWQEPPAPAFGELPSAQAEALDQFRRYTEQSALARLRSLADGSDAAGLAVTPRLLSGKSYAAILNLAAEEHADLIVLGVHGRNLLDRWLGSTANHVVRGAACPVLTLRG